MNAWLYFLVVVDLSHLPVLVVIFYTLLFLRPYFCFAQLGVKGMFTVLNCFNFFACPKITQSLKSQGWLFELCVFLGETIIFAYRWGYNQDTEECEEFNYGGCKGNLNSFLNEEECTNSCANKGTARYNKIETVSKKNCTNFKIYKHIKLFEIFLGICVYYHVPKDHVWTCCPNGKEISINNCQIKIIILDLEITALNVNKYI